MYFGGCIQLTILNGQTDIATSECSLLFMVRFALNWKLCSDHSPAETVSDVGGDSRRIQAKHLFRIPDPRIEYHEQ